jgi:hypothetical protein
MKDIGEAKPVSEQKKLNGVTEATATEKEKAAKEAIYKETAEANKVKEAKRSEAAKQPKAEQTRMDFGNPALEAEMNRQAKIKADRDAEAKEKRASKRAENEDFKDKRIKPSPIVVEAELAKMKEITAPKSKSSGGGGGSGMPKTGLNKKPEFKSGGKVSSASKRADGIAIRGKTRA